MTRRIAVIAVLMLTLFVLVRCTEMRSDADADQFAIRELIGRDSVWFDGSTTVDSASGGSFMDGDTWFIWWRGQQTHSRPNLELHVVQDSAWAEWSRQNFGQIYTMANIAGSLRTASCSSPFIIPPVLSIGKPPT